MKKICIFALSIALPSFLVAEERIGDPVTRDELQNLKEIPKELIGIREIWVAREFSFEYKEIRAGASDDVPVRTFNHHVNLYASQKKIILDKPLNELISVAEAKNLPSTLNQDSVICIVRDLSGKAWIMQVIKEKIIIREAQSINIDDKMYYMHDAKGEFLGLSSDLVKKINPSENQ